MVCPFCKLIPDSHPHLFFECDFPKEIWSRMKCLVGLDFAPNNLQALIQFMVNRPVNKTIWSILQRLLIGACVYYLWQERNLRIFQGKSSSVDDLCSLIRDVMRLRIMGLTLKASTHVFDAAKLWEFHVKQVNGKGRVKFVPWKNTVG
ncbi:reverse transcriptase zinc-binding domain-containing protein [Artemisia annua]|uniref:Reverse transcriptase zinc-binding domain-containing protein n=1 Tax=Artemisia annua TaxID=35608 RepID=A0A2U1NJU3_ARTAN|nr:reverse transcriptase zinc-binding domain-containing protein [Artemisia annua]